MIQLLATIKSFLLVSKRDSVLLTREQATTRLLNQLETFKAVDEKIPDSVKRENSLGPKE